MMHIIYVFIYWVSYTNNTSMHMDLDVLNQSDHQNFKQNLEQLTTSWFCWETGSFTKSSTWWVPVKPNQSLSCLWRQSLVGLTLGVYSYKQNCKNQNHFGKQQIDINPNLTGIHENTFKKKHIEDHTDHIRLRFFCLACLFDAVGINGIAASRTGAYHLGVSREGRTRQRMFCHVHGAILRNHKTKLLESPKFGVG